MSLLWFRIVCSCSCKCNFWYYNNFTEIVLQNKYCIFERKTDKQRVLVAINASDEPVTCHFDARCGTAIDLITNEKHDFGGGSTLPPYSIQYWDMETV